MAAEFDVQKRSGDSWVFQGKIRILATGEYDSIRIVQYDNNAIRITRYLSGANIGQTQRVDTDPPDFSASGTDVTAVFHAVGGRGIGCGREAETQVRVPPVGG